MNKQLLEHYIEAYGTDIYSFCIRLTQNRELAEELYQDTFLAMCERKREMSKAICLELP